MSDKNTNPNAASNTDSFDKYMEPFKYLESVSSKNRHMFNELLRYTNESLDQAKEQDK